MIAVSNLGLNFGKKILFENVSLKFKNNSRYGLIGANGSGKSTFLKILCGLEPSSSGSIAIDEGVKVGYLKQDHYEYENETVLNTVLRGDTELWRLIQERETIYSKDEMTDEEGIKIGELEEMYANLGGYDSESRAGELLEGLGIPTDWHDKKLSFLQGGLKLRVLLAQVLFQKPEVLLLDEPTNHLDIKTISWLENLLRSYNGVVIIISHDRHFINSVATHVVDLDYQSLKIYVGNYDDFMQASTQVREQLITENNRKKKKIAELQQFVNRFSANASKSKQATSRARQIEKIQLEEIKPSSRVSPYIRFDLKKQLGKDVIIAKNISKSYDKTIIFENFSTYITRGEKVAIIGNNGIGKTTLLKILLKKLQPTSGEVNLGETVEYSFFPQEHQEGIQEDKENLIDWLYRYGEPGTETSEIRAILGRMLFSGDMALKSTKFLSGGEKSRLIISRMLIEQRNVLVLDEPTNHLDLETIEALNYSLTIFPGTVLFVSHDREFVSSLATRIFEITKEKVVDFKGNYENYLEKERKVSSKK